MHLTGLNLRNVQKVIDKSKERLRCIPDIQRIVYHGKEVALRHILGILSHDHLIHTHDSIDRCTDLVGDIGKESCLGGVCTLSIISCLLDLLILSSDDSRFHKSPYNSTC